MHFPGPGPFGHGLGMLAGIFGAIIWAIGSLIMLALIVALIVLLVRYLWFGTKAAQRYLEVNGQPVRHVRTAGPGAAAPTAATPTAAAPTAATPTVATPTAAATKAPPRVRTTAPKKPPVL